jgi:uncharacterized protein YdeI (YjbR/CyaY-like superfamily)
MQPLPENAIHPLTRAEWRAWLDQHHTRAKGVWLVSYKRATGQPAIAYEEVVEEALCFGWIDSTANTLDSERSMLWIAPRRPGSGWSKPNKERVERLLASGQMTAAGLAKIEAAQRDGSWSRLDTVEALEIPSDLAAALASYPAARGFFDAFPRSARRAILAWIADARTAVTRAKRVAETARLATTNQRANEPRRTSPDGEAAGGASTR